MRKRNKIWQRLQHVETKLDLVIALCKNLILTGEKLMALADDLKAGIAKLDTECTQIGTVITALVDKLKAGNLSAQEQQEIFTALGAVSDRLTTLGVDPTNPVPPPPPQLQTAKKLAKVP